MRENVILIVIGCCLAIVYCENCPNGGQIFERGTSQAGKNAIINAHNYFRLQIAQGRVPGQPKGTNLLRQVYDDKLGEEARAVSNQCKMKHVTIKDSRWNWVGQNLFLTMSSNFQPGQDWNAAVNSWFSEYVDYQYPSGSKNGKVVGHYTQVVWHDSKSVGCDFIHYYDPDYPATPYAKLYSCNYGPGGNIMGQAPYSTQGNSCQNLC